MFSACVPHYNGSSFDPNSPISKLFNSNNGLRDYKRSLYEGGLRQAIHARWSKHIATDTVNDTPIAFWDILPTVAELTGGKIPDGVLTDGVSIVPTLLNGTPLKRDTFYW